MVSRELTKLFIFKTKNYQINKLELQFFPLSLLSVFFCFLVDTMRLPFKTTNHVYNLKGITKRFFMLEILVYYDFKVNKT